MIFWSFEGFHTQICIFLLIFDKIIVFSLIFDKFYVFALIY